MGLFGNGRIKGLFNKLKGSGIVAGALEGIPLFGGALAGIVRNVGQNQASSTSPIAPTSQPSSYRPYSVAPPQAPKKTIKDYLGYIIGGVVGLTTILILVFKKKGKKSNNRRR